MKKYAMFLDGWIEWKRIISQTILIKLTKKYMTIYWAHTKYFTCIISFNLEFYEVIISITNEKASSQRCE